MSKEISIIIPWRKSRQKDRIEIFDWCMARYKHLFPSAEIILCDDGHEHFSRGRSINKGVEESSGNYIVITDADYLFFSNFAEGIVNDYPWTVGVKGKNYYYIEEGYTNFILRNRQPDAEYESFEFNRRVSSCPFFVYGGVLAMPKENFIKFDPNMYNYGWEDNIFYLVMKAVYGEEHRTRANMFHMFHKRPAESPYMLGSYDNKKYYDSVWRPIENDRDAIIKKAKELKMYAP